MLAKLCNSSSTDSPLATAYSTCSKFVSNKQLSWTCSAVVDSSVGLFFSVFAYFFPNCHQYAPCSSELAFYCRGEQREFFSDVWRNDSECLCWNDSLENVASIAAGWPVVMIVQQVASMLLLWMRTYNIGCCSQTENPQHFKQELFFFFRLIHYSGVLE